MLDRIITIERPVISRDAANRAVTDYTDDLPPGGRGKGHHRSKGS